MVLFISGSDIFIILLFILIFFGADKIPEFMRVMGKGAREFRKATDDIKREFSENTSGVMNDIRSIQQDLTENLTKEITEPVQKTVNETEKTFDEYQDQYNKDFYYDYQNDSGYGYEYRNETSENTNESADDDTSGSLKMNQTFETESVSEPPVVKPKTRTAKPKTQTANSEDKPKTRTAKPKTQNANGETLNVLKPKTRTAKSSNSKP